MVMDFGFIKEVMMERIHNPCDHGLILWDQDETVLQHFFVSDRGGKLTIPKYPAQGNDDLSWLKLQLIPTVPTAENLAKIWYDEVLQGIKQWGKRNGVHMGEVELAEIRVWETPNCVAWYTPAPLPSLFPSTPIGGQYA